MTTEDYGVIGLFISLITTVICLTLYHGVLIDPRVAAMGECVTSNSAPDHRIACARALFTEDKE